MRFLLALSVSCLLSAQSAHAQASPRPTEGFARADDGRRLYYRVDGQGADTVVVPLAVWLAPELQPLARNRVVIFYDPRSRGRSDMEPDTAKLGIDADVADLEAVRRHFKLGRMQLLGWSYFGGMAAQYAMRHPERVTRLVQLHPITPRRDPYLDRDMGERRRRGDATAWQQLQQLQRDGAPQRDPIGYCRTANRFFFSLQVADTASLRAFKADVCSVENERSLDRLFARAPAARPYDWRPQVAQLRVPTLVVHGTQDPIPLEGVREWAMRPEARIFLVQRAGHFAFAERPDRLFPALEEFLGGTWPATAERVPEAEGAGAGVAPPIAAGGAFFGISVADIARQSAWYRDTLGFREISSGVAPDGAIRFALLYSGNTLIELLQLPDARPLRLAVPNATGAHQVHGVFKGGFVVEDIDAAHRALVQKQVTLAYGLGQANATYRSFGVRDPEGNLLQFFGR